MKKTEPFVTAEQIQHIVEYRLGVRKGQECHRCHGFGKINYSHGSTWRGGVGPTGGRFDTCNHCWGSGLESAPGVNLKELEEKYARAIECITGFVDHFYGDDECDILHVVQYSCCNTHKVLVNGNGPDWKCPVALAREILKGEVRDGG